MTNPDAAWVSTFKPLPPAVPMLPRECYRALRHLKADGSWDRLPTPATDALIKHAERYGTECIAETAAEFMGEEGLTALIRRLDVIGRRLGEKAAGRFTRAKSKTKPADVRARALLGIPEEEETE